MLKAEFRTQAWRTCRSRGRARCLGWMAALLCGLWLVHGGSSLGAAELAGSPFTVEAWGTEEGLPQSSVISVIQTRDGYLWLGTLKGLVRFDGTRFTVFNEYKTPELKSDQIVCLFEDSHTNLWVGMDSGDVALIHDGKVINVSLGGVGPDSRLTSACEDAQGAVWLYTFDSRLARYQNGTFEIEQLFPDQQPISRMVAADQAGSIWISEYEPSVSGGKGLLLSFRADNFHPPAVAFDHDHTYSARRIDAILASRQGGLWRLMDGRVQKWNGSTNDVGPYPWPNSKDTAVTVTAVCEDPDGNLIVGTHEDGVYWFDGTGDYRHISREQGLSSNFILSLCVDREGNLWVGTDGDGLNRVKKRTFLSPTDLLPLSAQSIAADGAGGLWTAFNAHGVDLWRSNSVQHFDVGAGKNAWTVLVDRQQQVWVGTRQEGLFALQNGQFQPAPQADALGQQIFALFEDRDARLWVGTAKGLAGFDGQAWALFAGQNGPPETTVRAIAQDRAGNLWIGTENQGLGCLKDGKFISFPAGEAGPPGNDISALFFDREGVLWAGTSGHGLARLQNGRWTHYSTRDGLAGNSISFIIADDEGNLWIGSNAGLMRIPRKDGAIQLAESRTFGQADGLPTRECSIGSQPAACRSGNGRLWFPTAKGLVWVNPADFKPDQQPPLVMIESVKVDKAEQKTNSLSSTWSQAIVMPADAEQLEIDYTGLHFTAPQQLRFRYWLDGDKTYTEAGHDRVVRYPKFWPGHYVFHVTACNEDGVWNEKGSTLEITVLPEFWQTRTFLAGVVVVILALVAGVVRYLSTQKLKREVALFKQQEALEKERSRIARDLHDQLGANLTQMALLGEMAKSDRELPEEVESHADQILLTARETTNALDEIVWAVNPSNDTLEGLANYAVKYAQEYLALAGLRYRADVPAQLAPAAIPPEVRHNVFLAFKESVNNVVKHAQASEVWIRLQVSADRFTLEIADNGRGLAHMDPNRAKTRNGLRNLRKRLEEIHGEFSMTPGPEGGTIVRLTAPLVNSGK